jgi:hypothetical protein
MTLSTRLRRPAALGGGRNSAVQSSIFQAHDGTRVGMRNDVRIALEHSDGVYLIPHSSE